MNHSCITYRENLWCNSLIHMFLRKTLCIFLALFSHNWMWKNLVTCRSLGIMVPIWQRKSLRHILYLHGKRQNLTWADKPMSLVNQLHGDLFGWVCLACSKCQCAKCWFNFVTSTFSSDEFFRLLLTLQNPYWCSLNLCACCSLAIYIWNYILQILVEWNLQAFEPHLVVIDRIQLRVDCLGNKNLHFHGSLRVDNKTK